MSGVVESKGTLQDSVEFLTNLRQIVTPEEAGPIVERLRRDRPEPEFTISMRKVAKKLKHKVT